MQQHIIGGKHEEPLPAQRLEKFYRRHIVINHFHKEILIQVMWDYSGQLKQSEFSKLNAGLWAEFVPREIATEFQAALGSGYKVRPIAFMGGNSGEAHTILQIIDINDGRSVKGDILKPIDENQFPS